jgi:hypothetical protein
MSAVLELLVRAAYELEERLMKQGCGRERVSGFFSSHVPDGEVVQLAVNQRNQLIEGAGVTFFPGVQ